MCMCNAVTIYTLQMFARWHSIAARLQNCRADLEDCARLSIESALVMGRTVFLMDTAYCGILYWNLSDSFDEKFELSKKFYAQLR